MSATSALQEACVFALEAFLALLIVFWLAILRGFRRSLTMLKNPPDSGRVCGYAVITPCRNCSGTVGRLIKSIASQTLKPVRVVLVDDGSSDDSAGVAESIAKELGIGKLLTVIRVKEIPEGWIPKNHACYVGYLSVRGVAGVEALLFIDSDTWFLRRDAAERIVREALAAGLASYAPRFECRTRVCRAMESILTTLSHAITGFHKVLNPSSRVAWFYGCCWCVRRDVYEAIGTHELVRCELVEDRALAARAKELGYRLSILRGFKYVATLWHDDVRGTVNALIRVFWTAILREPHRAAITSLLLAMPYWLPLAGLATSVAVTNPLLATLSAGAYVACAAAHAMGSRLNGNSIAYGLAAPASAAILTFSLARMILKGNFEWRGRSLESLTRCLGSSSDAEKPG